MPDWLGLQRQRVVVAGGAGGFGSALVAAFGDAGAEVVAIDVAAGDHVQADLRDPPAASTRRPRARSTSSCA
jgi:NAD(P)-dependent dehydrogenase (short-subunit alcohol dehydrogenase family)